MRQKFQLACFLLLACCGLWSQNIISAKEIRLVPEAQPAGFAGVYKLYLDSTTFQFGCINPAGGACTISGNGGGGNWNFRGAWLPSTAYAINDVVTNGGSTYLATAAITGTTSFNPGSWNLIAQVGAAGAQGAPGTAASISIGATNTLAPGASATVSNAGTAQAAILNFGIPQGSTGPIGPTGPTGPAGAGFNFRGAWTTATAYNPGDVVTNGGQTYETQTAFTSAATFAGDTGWFLWAATGATGPQGIPGGSINWRGAWNSATAYAINDAVSDGTPASSYYATAAGTNHEPPNVSFWALIASAGATGSTGATGGTGPTGATGPTGQGFNFRGAWVASTAYAPYDVVTNGGNTYEASTSFVSGTTFNTGSGEAWNLLAQGASGGNGPNAVLNNQANTYSTGKQTFAASTSGAASTNTPSGVVVTAPVLGDHWLDANGMWDLSGLGIPACDILTDSSQNETAANMRICAPTTVATAGTFVLPTAPATGILHVVNTSGNMPITATKVFPADLDVTVFPQVVSATSLLSQNAAIAATTAYAVPSGADGLYQVCQHMLIDTVGAGGGTLNGQFTWTDRNSVTKAFNVNSSIAGTSTQNVQYGCMFLQIKGSTNIQYAVQLGGSYTTFPVYDYYVIITRYH